MSFSDDQIQRWARWYVQATIAEARRAITPADVQSAFGDDWEYMTDPQREGARDAVHEMARRADVHVRLPGEDTPAQRAKQVEELRAENRRLEEVAGGYRLLLGEVLAERDRLAEREQRVRDLADELAGRAPADQWGESMADTLAARPAHTRLTRAGGQAGHA